MAIRIAQASSSENFGKFGTPPNQRRTGVTAKNPGGNMDGELNIAAFHVGFDNVFRCTDPIIADRAATYAEHAVANGSHVGYGQNWIDDKYPMSGLFDAMRTAKDHDPKNIKTLVNCSCATLLGAAYYWAGIKDERLRLLNTKEQEQILLSTGKFIKLTDKDLVRSGRGIKRGDILHRIGHTAIVLDNDMTDITIPYRTANCAFCNLRTGPSINDKVIEVIAGNEIVLYISTASNDWGQVQHGNNIGYIAPQYLEPLPKAVATADCWLRKQPKVAKETEVIVIPKGATPGISGKTQKVGSTTWYEVVYASKIGWASGKLLKV